MTNEERETLIQEKSTLCSECLTCMFERHLSNPIEEVSICGCWKTDRIGEITEILRSDA